MSKVVIPDMNRTIQSYAKDVPVLASAIEGDMQRICERVAKGDMHGASMSMDNVFRDMVMLNDHLLLISQLQRLKEMYAEGE